MATPSLSLHIEGFDQYDRIDFNKKEIRKGFRKVGRIVERHAKGLLAAGGGKAGYPALRSGALLNAIKARVSRSGFMVKIMPDMPAGAKEYYPAYLHYGVRRGAVRRKGHRAQPVGPWRISPRDNYMTDALALSETEARSVLFAALQRGLQPK